MCERLHSSQSLQSEGSRATLTAAIHFSVPDRVENVSIAQAGYYCKRWRAAIVWTAMERSPDGITSYSPAGTSIPSFLLEHQEQSAPHMGALFSSPASSSLCSREKEPELARV